MESDEEEKTYLITIANQNQIGTRIKRMTDRIEVLKRELGDTKKTLEMQFNTSAEGLCVLVTSVSVSLSATHNPNVVIFNEPYDNLKTATAQMVLGIDLEKAEAIFLELATSDEGPNVNLDTFFKKLDPLAVY